MVFSTARLCLCIFFVMTFSSDSKSDLGDGTGKIKYHVEKLTSCSARISKYGTINLKPLERTDGFPRFSTSYRNADRPAVWNYSFNPCQPYNEPFDLTAKNLFGEKCLSVSICKFGKSAGKYFYYTYGRQDSAKFSVTSQNDIDKPTIVTLTFNGTGGNHKKKTHIRLICDESLYHPDDAVFTIQYDNMRTGITSELRHICCCPDACINGLPTGNISSAVENKDKKKSKTPDSTTLLIIAGLNIGLLVLAGLIGGMCYSKRSTGTPRVYSKLPGVHSVPTTQMNFGSIDLEKDTLEMPGTSRSSIRDYEPWAQRKKQIMMPVYDDCVIPNDSLELAQRLGGGIYGDTYVGDVKGLKVAVTRITLIIHKSQSTPEILKWLKDEVWFLSRQRHRNIVAMLGLCTENKLPYIMSEFIDGFTVKSYIQNKGELVSWPLRVKICLQAADGVAYLHSTKPPIIHRDLRCANIFISDHEIVKVGDFGLIKLIQPLRSLCREEDCCCQGSYCACPSSLRWTAPEILEHPTLEESDGFISPKSDVYSFGMCMWEIVMCDDPFDDVNTEQEVMELVKEGIRPTVPSTVNVMPQYRALMNQCWNGQAENRPSFKHVATKLKELVSPARNFQKNILNKMRLQKLQIEVDSADSDRPKSDGINDNHLKSRIKNDSINGSANLSNDSLTVTRTAKKSVVFKNDV